jgi:hypothetical protein
MDYDIWIRERTIGKALDLSRGDTPIDEAIKIVL